MNQVKVSKYNVCICIYNDSVHERNPVDMETDPISYFTVAFCVASGAGFLPSVTLRCHYKIGSLKMKLNI